MTSKGDHRYQPLTCSFTTAIGRRKIVFTGAATKQRSVALGHRIPPRSERNTLRFVQSQNTGQEILRFDIDNAESIIAEFGNITRRRPRSMAR